MLALDPTLQVAALNLGAVLYEQGHHAASLDWTRRALQMKPDCGLAHYNTANALRELGQIPAAIGSYQTALRHQPAFPRAAFNLGLAHLLLGDFRAGWPLFEHREAAGEVVQDLYPQPVWDGSSLENKTLLIHAEQGIGDEILFATCVPDVAVPPGACCSRATLGSRGFSPAASGMSA